ncbi:C40 family peptidase [Chitinophaga japonensis]|uniref:NlpC/P60 family protein n=1 Tax=Chitinophaga japonensis TaxID=104662 RepID=A0A562T6G4_CHIJA|nr:C40 family peptidase [Chitinophaga japonensis]TWI89115.1 NlpC/P60 family protein [Chitinophaga japonensis]
MPYAIIVVPVMPLRATASHKSEMISQGLWGECVTLLETGADGWVRVKCQFDGYEGWATASHLETIDQQLFDAPYTHYAPHWVTPVSINGWPMYIPYGCLVKAPGVKRTVWGKAEVQFEEIHPLAPQEGQPSGDSLMRIASRFLNCGYLWGGRSVFGIDCSGFTQSVYKLLNVPLLRDAYQQATQGVTVDFLQEARTGDLAFFDNEEGHITHVGILLNDHEIIHASGKVRIDAIDNQGIINTDTGLRTHKLRIIRRLVKGE